MFRRRRDSDENPAWPGLVDLYAFTLIIFVFMFASDKITTRGEDFDERPLEERIEIVEGEKRDLEDYNQELLKEINQMRSDLELAQSDAIKRMQQEAHKRAQKLREELQIELGEGWGQLEPVHSTLPEFDIINFQGGPILFDRAKHSLADHYGNYVKKLSEALAQVLVSYPDAEIEVRGTADPDPYHGKGEIKDNVDLSAMRAATVAKLLKKGVAGRDNFMIVGLGEIGDVIDDPDMKEMEYRKYRRVQLKIRIPPVMIAES